MSEKKMSMRDFTLEFLKNNPGANPNWLAAEWFQYKNDKFPRAASRDMFGTTSAAYRTLRKLRDEGLVSSDRSENNFHINIIRK